MRNRSFFKAQRLLGGSSGSPTNAHALVLMSQEFYPECIKEVLRRAGIVVRRIERLPTHPVWRMWLTVKSFNLTKDRRAAAEQIRNLLCNGGVKIARGYLSIISKSRDKIVCAFMLASLN